MRLRLQGWLNLLIGGLSLLVVVNSIVAYANLRRLRQSGNAVAQALAVLESLESNLATLTDAETAQRGYLITRDPKHVPRSKAAIANSTDELDTIAALSSSNSRLLTRIPEIRRLAILRQSEIERTIALGEQGRFDEAIQLMRDNEAQRTMESLRGVVGEMQHEERNLLTSREADDDRAYHSAVVGSLVSTAIGLCALAAVLLLLRRYLRSVAQLAERLGEQREMLQSALISIGDAVVVTDAHGRITFVNRTAEQLTGWSLHESLGAELTTVCNILSESNRRPIDNPAARILQEGRPACSVNQCLLLGKTGSELPIEGSANPIKENNGDVCGAVLVFRDTSARKRQEAAIQDHTVALQAANARLQELLAELKESEELFRSMADSMPQLAWMARPNGQVYWYNHRWYEYTGVTPAQMEGKDWQTVVDPRERPRVVANWRTAIGAEQSWEDTFPLRRHDGEMRWHLSRAVPVRNDRGQIMRWFGTNTDVTERMEMEQALREADHRKDEFLATLAHELRNPIAPISNALQVWPMVDDNPVEVEKLRGIMERQVRQLSRLIDDLLDVSRITRGKIQLRRQPVDLNTIVEEAVEAVAPLIHSSSHQLQVVTAASPLIVDGDVARLTQIVGNLLNNAAKYTPREGRLRIALERDGNEALIRVSDNGPGIPTQMLERIFDMFQQIDQTLDRAHGGLGLGLTLVKRLVTLHGGEVIAQSDGEGHGSEFIVRLPLLQQQAVPPPTSVSPRAAVPRHRILVVDDVYASAKTLAMMLQSINQDVEIASDGPSALEEVERRRPDVVFLDIAMPGMSGYDVAKSLRKNSRLAGLYLVALTGYGHDDDRRRAIEAGFHHHLTKPASIDQLSQLLCSVPVAESEVEA